MGRLEQLRAVYEANLACGDVSEVALMRMQAAIAAAEREEQWAETKLQEKRQAATAALKSLFKPSDDQAAQQGEISSVAIALQLLSLQTSAVQSGIE